MELDLSVAFTRYFSFQNSLYFFVCGSILINFPLFKLPAVMWTEDYQILTLHKHFPAFDYLRSNGLLAGEMIWNFIDFATPQGTVSFLFINVFPLLGS